MPAKRTTIESKRNGSRQSVDRVLIGAHVGGGLTGAVSKALEINAQVVQIFIGSPQTWKPASPAEEDFERFRQGVREHNLGPVFVHGNYLVNLGSADSANLKKSVGNLHTTLRLSERAGAQGLIFHPGSAGQRSLEEALETLVTSLKNVLKDYDGDCKLLLEVCAGQGQTLGERFHEFARVLDAMGYDKRLGICWDTCHLFSAGYDISTPEGLESTVEEFEKTIGFEWLYAVHANDSKTPLGAKRDRHENIGEGHIGKEAFRRMLHHPRLRSLPWILEVPGYEKKGPDQRSIEMLRKLAGVGTDPRSD